MSERSLIRDIRYRLEAAVAYVLYWIFRLLPVDAGSALAGRLARWFGPMSRAQKTAQQNLASAFPHLSQQDRQNILSDVWDNLGRVMSEYASLSRIKGTATKSRIDIEGEEHLQGLTEAQSPAIFFSGHLGNWEAIHLTLSAVLRPPAIVYRTPNNPYVDGLLRTARGPTTNGQIAKGSSGAREMIRTLKDGGLIAMLVDQKMNTGMAIPLFDRDAMAGDAIARLALKSGCALVPMRVERTGGCRFKVTFEAPWTFDQGSDTDSNVRDLLVRINNKLEAWIRERPGQWLWLHNRWPKEEPLP